LEQFSTVDTTNKDAVIQLIDGFVATIDGIIADNQMVTLDGKTLAQARRWIFIARSFAQGIRIAVASVSQPTPRRTLLIDEANSRKIAARASERFTDDDALLTQDIIVIATDFYVKIKSQRGQTVEWLREQRRNTHTSNQAFFDQHLQRI